MEPLNVFFFQAKRSSAIVQGYTKSLILVYYRRVHAFFTFYNFARSNNCKIKQIQRYVIYVHHLVDI